MTSWERAVRAHMAIDSEAHGDDDTICESGACDLIVAEIDGALQEALPLERALGELAEEQRIAAETERTEE